MVVWGAPHLTERAGGLDFTVSPQSFRQTNPRQGEVLLRLISDAAGASLASAARPEDDVFAGCAVVTWVTSLCVWAVVCEAQSDRMAQWRQGWRLRVGRAGSNAVAVLSCSLAQCTRGQMVNTFEVGHTCVDMGLVALQAFSETGHAAAQACAAATRW